MRFPDAPLPNALRDSQRKIVPLIRKHDAAAPSRPHGAPDSVRPAPIARSTAVAAWLPRHFSPIRGASSGTVLPASIARNGRITWAMSLPCDEVVASPENHVVVWCGYPAAQLQRLRQLVGQSGRVLHVWGAATVQERAHAWRLARQFLIIRVLWCEPWTGLCPPRPVPHWHRPQIVRR
jgi:hypothetical protein